jgi:hypothetical protein
MELKLDEQNLIRRKVNEKCEKRNAEFEVKMKAKFDKQVKEALKLMKQKEALAKKVKSIGKQMQKVSKGAISLLTGSNGIYDDEPYAKIYIQKHPYKTDEVYNDAVDEFLLNDNITLKDIIAKINKI